MYSTSLSSLLPAFPLPPVGMAMSMSRPSFPPPVDGTPDWLSSGMDSPSSSSFWKDCPLLSSGMDSPSSSSSGMFCPPPPLLSGMEMPSSSSWRFCPPLSSGMDTSSSSSGATGREGGVTGVLGATGMSGLNVSSSSCGTLGALLLSSGSSKPSSSFPPASGVSLIIMPLSSSSVTLSVRRVRESSGSFPAPISIGSESRFSLLTRKGAKCLT